MHQQQRGNAPRRYIFEPHKPRKVIGVKSVAWWTVADGERYASCVVLGLRVDMYGIHQSKSFSCETLDGWSTRTMIFLRLMADERTRDYVFGRLEQVFLLRSRLAFVDGCAVSGGSRIDEMGLGAIERRWARVFGDGRRLVSEVERRREIGVHP